MCQKQNQFFCIFILYSEWVSMSGWLMNKEGYRGALLLKSHIDKNEICGRKNFRVKTIPVAHLGRLKVNKNKHLGKKGWTKNEESIF